MEGRVRKLLVILCILAAVASAGWEAYDAYAGGTRSDLMHVGDFSVSEGATVQFTGQDDYHLVGLGEFSVVRPLVLQVNGILWLLSAVLAFAAGIALLAKRP